VTSYSSVLSANGAAGRFWWYGLCIILKERSCLGRIKSAPVVALAYILVLYTHYGRGLEAGLAVVSRLRESLHYIQHFADFIMFIYFPC